MSRFYVQAQKFQLAGSGCSSSATSINLVSFKITKADGTTRNITMSDFGDLGLMVLDPGIPRKEETITFTGVTQNGDGSATLTGVTRGITPFSPYGSDSSYASSHSGFITAILSNPAKMYSRFISATDDVNVTGLWTFLYPTSDYEPAVKKYVDDVLVGLVGTASTTTFGTVKISTAAVNPLNPIVVGDNDTRIPTQGENDALVGNNTDIVVGTNNLLVTQTGLQKNTEKYAADTSGSSTAYVITLTPAPTSYATGMIIYAKIVNSNTTTTPTLNMNGLGAKTIVKPSGALEIGDISANMPCVFMYDGANIVLLSPTAGGATYPLVGFQQLGLNFSDTVAASSLRITSESDGSVLYAAYIPSAGVGLVNLLKFTRDSKTGMYYLSATGSSTFLGGAFDSNAALSIAVIGSYVYVASYHLSAIITRFDKSNFANQTNITISGTAFSNAVRTAFSDGTDLYVYTSSATFYRYTISGTTATNAATITYTSSGASVASISDGTTAWLLDGSTIRAYAKAGGSASASLASQNSFGNNYPYPTSNPSLFIPKTGFLDLALIYTATNDTAKTGSFAALTPFTQI